VTFNHGRYTRFIYIRKSAHSCVPANTVQESCAVPGDCAMPQ